MFCTYNEFGILVSNGKLKEIRKLPVCTGFIEFSENFLHVGKMLHPNMYPVQYTYVYVMNKVLLHAICIKLHTFWWNWILVGKAERQRQSFGSDKLDIRFSKYCLSVSFGKFRNFRKIKLGDFCYNIIFSEQCARKMIMSSVCVLCLPTITKCLEFNQFHGP